MSFASRATRSLPARSFPDRCALEKKPPSAPRSADRCCRSRLRKDKRSGGAPCSARIEGTAQEDAQRSAASAVRSAENQLALSQREAERTEQLVAGGALAARDLDQARTAVTQAEAQLADARARLVAAEKQFGDAVLRAPLTGIVSDRAVNAGDVVTPGTALFTIIDPSSMRLEASVPSDELSALKVGGRSQFRVRGYDQHVRRHDRADQPGQADPTTRQVPIFVVDPECRAGGWSPASMPKGASSPSRPTAWSCRCNAVNTTGAEPWVLRAANGKAERVAVQLGLRDPRTEQVAIQTGVNEGDILLRGAAQGITPGTPCRSASRRRPRLRNGRKGGSRCSFPISRSSVRSSPS